MVCQEICPVPNVAMANFDKKRELATYRGQWSQVELALDFQLENKDGGACQQS